MPVPAVQLRVELNYITPPIWRQLAVPAHATLDNLHEVLQVVMGWSNSHLYSFNIRKQEYQQSPPDFSPFPAMLGLGHAPRQPLCSQDVSLAQLALNTRSKFGYEYDFGDSWLHTLVVERNYQAEDDAQIPFCIAGERNCPPEDCGSFPGYMDVLRALAEPQQPQHQELLEWVGDYDPEQFDIENVNRILTSYFATKRTTKPRVRVGKRKK